MSTLSAQEVQVAAESLERFRPLLGDGPVEEALAIAQKLRAALAGRRLWNVNSTAVGGGVAEMMRLLLAYARGAGLDARWWVLRGDAEFFRITKRLHNALHGERGDGSLLGAGERVHYEKVCAENLQTLVGAAGAQPGDVVLLHDPQTAGLAAGLIAAGFHVAWRSHIGADHTNAESEHGWEFLAPYLATVPTLIFSRKQYAPPIFSDRRVVIIQPSIDPFSTKNQELPPRVIRDVLRETGLVGSRRGIASVKYRRTDGTEGEVTHAADVMNTGSPPALETPLVVEISRWDTLKDHKGVMESFALLVERGGAGDAELLLCGPNVTAVADDPEGARVFADVAARWHQLPHEIRRRIHLASIPVHDLDENAIIINAIQRHAAVVVQKSLQEGFGLTVTEPMWKGKPVVASRVGGIADQIVHEESGLLVDDPTDLVGFAGLLGRVLADRKLAARLGAAARERAHGRFLSLRHLKQFGAVILQLFER